MPQFTYKAKKGPHEVIVGKLEATDKEQAIRTLDGLGLIPIQIYSKQELTHKVSLKPAAVGRLRQKEITPFVRNLANLIQGNVAILKALALLARQSKGALGETIIVLRDSVRDGLALSQAMGRLPGTFPPLWIAMVRGGESAGVLGKMLERLADHEEKAEDLRRKVRGALVYPLVLLVVGFGTVFVLLTYFMPRLVGVYEQNRQDLPLPTELVLGASQFLSSNWYWLIGFFIFVLALLKRMGGVSNKAWWDTILLKLPLVRGLTLKSSFLHFTRTLSLLLAQGVPLVKGVSLATATVNNSVLGGQLAGIEERLVRRGESLATALKRVPLCPVMMIDMISVGEESGSLSASLTHIANTYDRDLEALIKSLATLIEPLFILIIGSIIGFIVFAMLMPVFQMDVFID